MCRVQQYNNEQNIFNNKNLKIENKIFIILWYTCFRALIKNDSL